MKRKNGSIRNGKTEKTMMNDVLAHPTNHLVLFGLIQQIYMVDPDLVASRQWHRPCSCTTTALRTHAFIFAFFSPTNGLTSSRGRTPHTAPFSLPASSPCVSPFAIPRLPEHPSSFVTGEEDKDRPPHPHPPHLVTAPTPAASAPSNSPPNPVFSACSS